MNYRSGLMTYRLLVFAQKQLFQPCGQAAGDILWKEGTHVTVVSTCDRVSAV